MSNGGRLMLGNLEESVIDQMILRKRDRYVDM